MTSAALKCEEPRAYPDPAETDVGTVEILDSESLFAVFVDEIDAWARHALAANGFGDLP